MLNGYVLAAYAVFLLVIAVVNLLYFIQIFKYRLPGDASIPVLIIHLIAVGTVLVISSIYLGLIKF